MHLRPRHLFSLLLLILPCFCYAQTDKLPTFPQDFTGKWAGELQIFGPSGVRQTVPMELHILPITDTSYTYTIIYGEDKVAGKRDYYIVQGPDGPHHWICDEKNTILLDGYYLGSTYQSVFTIGGTYLMSSVEHRGDHLVYAIFSGKEAPVRTTGETKHDGEDIPAVNSYKVSGYQRSILRQLTE